LVATFVRNPTGTYRDPIIERSQHPTPIWFAAALNPLGFYRVETTRRLFDGDHVIRAKKELNVLDRESGFIYGLIPSTSRFSARTKLDIYGRLDPTKQQNQKKKVRTFFG